jgi:hypothetical protein
LKFGPTAQPDSTSAKARPARVLLIKARSR